MEIAKSTTFEHKVGNYTFKVDDKFKSDGQKIEKILLNLAISEAKYAKSLDKN